MSWYSAPIRWLRYAVEFLAATTGLWPFVGVLGEPLPTVRGSGRHASRGGLCAFVLGKAPYLSGVCVTAKSSPGDTASEIGSRF
jgi:hypothetical protein